MGIGRDIHCSISSLVVKPIVAIDGLRGQFTADTKLVILLGDVRFWDILPRIPPSPPCVCVCVTYNVNIEARKGGQGIHQEVHVR